MLNQYSANNAAIRLQELIYYSPLLLAWPTGNGNQIATSFRYAT